MKKILYLNNYLSEDILIERNNANIYSQPANNKINGILTSLKAAGCKIKVLSSGLVNSNSLRKYPKKTDVYCDAEVVYCPIIDFPIINTLSSIFYMYTEIKNEHKKDNIDNIIFYNYKPEVAWPAYFAKKFLKIPITVEYEDGYSHVDKLGTFKRFIFRRTEKQVSKEVDSAILVTSLIEKKYNVPTVVVRGVVNAHFYEECRNYKKQKNEKFTILYSGGLDEARGINILLKALDYLEFDCCVIITGKGQLKNTDPRVDFKGFISYKEVKQLMMQADVLVQCQLAGHNFGNVSFPSKLFEYIATGNYIISSDVSDVKDFAGNSILYYHNDNPEELSIRIKEINKLWIQNDAQREGTVDKLCNENLPKNLGGKILRILA